MLYKRGIDYNNENCKIVNWHETKQIFKILNSSPSYINAWVEKSWQIIVEEKLFENSDCNASKHESLLWIVVLLEVYIDFLHFLKRIRSDSLYINELKSKLIRELESVKNKEALDNNLKEVFENEICIRRSAFTGVVFINLNNSNLEVMFYMAGNNFTNNEGIRMTEPEHVTIPELGDLIEVRDYSKTREILPLYLWIKSGMKKLV